MATFAPLLDKAFTAEREFLRIASKSRQPEPAQLASLLKSTGDCIDEIQAAREKMRRLEISRYNKYRYLSRGLYQ